MVVRAIRGATQLETDDADHMHERVVELLTGVLEANGLTQDDVISILFTATSDLTSAFPAVAARSLGFSDVPLICARELDIAGSLPRAVRLLAHVESPLAKSDITHVYLHGAVTLRPDLTSAQ
ncbi:MAG: chorismate mutase [Nocardioides sp.]|uniref:chorismate mutase n=1 Tax=Nocardioides sp. TaxID=35761 RepID=UPI0039E6E9CB